LLHTLFVKVWWVENPNLVGIHLVPPILVLPDLMKDFNKISPQLFEHLAYQNVTKTFVPFTPAKLSFYLDGKNISTVLHGLKVTCGKKTGQYKAEPTIYIVPMLFIKTLNGRWFRVMEEGENYEHELPYHYNHLPEHLRIVEKAGKRLTKAVCTSLGCKVTSKSLQEYYQDANFDTFRAFRICSSAPRNGGKQFEIVTGQYYHYIRLTPLVERCPFHSWATCKDQGVSIEQAILKRSVDPRSFFTDGEDHYYSHRATLEKKQEPLNADNKDRCGPRSGRNGEAFCEIYS
jgi:hypothetical protein